MNIRKSILMLAVFCLITVAFAPVVQVARADTDLLPLECMTAIDEGWGESAWTTVCLWRLNIDNIDYWNPEY